ncbi:MAG: FimB/Mfa2 family fimbrial subunit [Bacteroides sp.]|nr:FimB/Mfa2 family fimbrial subunit [Bacteroides sp.]
MRLLKSIISGVAVAAMTLTGMSSLTSCNAIYEDLDPCVSGARLRFVYDYNMEFANAFHTQVDCLTLHVYDADGHFLRTLTADRSLTSDEGWRMDIDLPPGRYRMVAWGGMQCGDASFGFLSAPESTAMTDLKVGLRTEATASGEGAKLHHLYYGSVEMTIPPAGTVNSYTEATVYMKKDTNDIRILLGNESGLPTDEADFTFSITADNTVLGYDNEPLQAGAHTWLPFSKGNKPAGILPNGHEATLAFAEISTSRLMDGHGVTLRITRNSDGYDAVKIPLVNLLLLLKSDRFSQMDSQEFLDRQSLWNITFMLTDEGKWSETSIIINDWIVRINTIPQL